MKDEFIVHPSSIARSEYTMFKFFNRANNRWWIIGGLVVVVGVGVAVVRFVQSSSARASDHSAEAAGGKATLGFQDNAKGVADKPAATPTDTVPVQVERTHTALTLTGTLMADEKSAVASNVSGIVADVRVDRGSLVRKGDVLIQLDPTDAQNRLNEGLALVEELRTRLGLENETAEPFDAENQPEVKMARAAWQLAVAQYKRTSELYEKRVISSEIFDQVRTEHESSAYRYRQALNQIRQTYQAYKTAQTRLASLRKALKDATITAPFDGLVAEKLVAPGEYVASGPQAAKLVTLVRINPLRLSLAVPQQSIGFVRAGQRVAFEVDSFPGRTFQGELRYISPVVTADTRTLIAEAVVDNADGALRPGLFAKARLELPEQKVELYVPPTAVQRTGEVARVFVVREGVARERVVSLGEASGARVEVRSGLDGSETVVAQADKVRDGQRVR